MKAWLKTLFVLSAASALALSGCGSKEDSADGDTSPSTAASLTAAATASVSPSAETEMRIKVVATFYPMYEFSRQVAGDLADVTALIPSGVEPHDWEPTAKDMAAIQEADVFVYNGIVEGWAEQALSGTVNDKRVVVEASHGLELVEGVEDGHGHEGEEAEEHEGESAGESAEEHEDEHGLDPHVWLSPVLAQHEVNAIADALGKADPAHTDDYRKNADAYIAKLKELDQSFKVKLANVKRKEFVTQHAAFGYLAKEYGLTQVPISGLSPEQEPSPAEMAGVVELAKEHDVKTIFFETLVDPKIAETIADEVKAKTDVLNPLEGLTVEDLANNLDYIAIMNKNLEALVKALNE